MPLTQVKSNRYANASLCIVLALLLATLRLHSLPIHIWDSITPIPLQSMPIPEITNFSRHPTRSWYFLLLQYLVSLPNAQLAHERSPKQEVNQPLKRFK